MPQKKLRIRNSTVEFLIFTKQTGENGIEVRVQDGTIWLSQKLLAALFDCTTDNISLHLKNIFAEKELDETSVTEDFSVTASDGELEEASVTKDFLVTASDGKNYKTRHYNAESEFEKYRIIQDHLFESDFDRDIKTIEGKGKK